VSATRRAAGTLLLALAALPAAAFEQRFTAFVSLRGIAVDGERSWLDGGLGKLRYGDDDEPIGLGAANVSYRARFTPTVSFHGSATAYGDGDHAIDLDEAFLEWKPVPRSAWRWQARAGAFHAPFSLENTEPGWRTPYTISSSALNTWLGEELRTIGGELQLTHAGAHAGSPHDFTLLGALYRANDPAGALLSWRGWALSDRQTGLFERLPLAPLPGFTDTGSFPPQGDFEEPFREIDHRTGYYAGAQWDYLQRSRLRVQRYDNCGDPGALTLAGQQWAWRTRFEHVAWHLRLPRDTELIAQHAWGNTEMDGFTGPLVDADFRASFLLLSHSFERQRVSVRYDRFAVEDRDPTPDDPNDETGHAWTAAWFLAGERTRYGSWRVGAEYLQVASWRPARTLFGNDAHQDERSLQLLAEWKY
jgi:hypothetical protein